MPTLDEQYAYVRRLVQHVHDYRGSLADRSDWMREPNVVLDSEKRNIMQVRLPTESRGHLDPNALTQLRSSLPELAVAQFALRDSGNRAPVDVSCLFAEGGMPPRLRLIIVGIISKSSPSAYCASISTFRHLPRSLETFHIWSCLFSSPPNRAVPLADLPPMLKRMFLGEQSEKARAELRAQHRTPTPLHPQRIPASTPPLLLCGSIVACPVAESLSSIQPPVSGDALGKLDVVVGDAELFGPNTRSIITCRQFLNLAHKYRRGMLSADTARALSMTGEFAADTEFAEEHRKLMD